jgi:hypothetical protein
MKYALLQVAVLTAVGVLAAALGKGLATRVWGPAGVTSLYASTVICLIAGVLAAIPLGLVATYRRTYAPHVAFAGTAIRLLVTAGLGLAYVLLARPEPMSFVVCIGAVYLLLLLAETVLIVYIVLRVFTRNAPGAE